MKNKKLIGYTIFEELYIQLGEEENRDLPYILRTNSEEEESTPKQVALTKDFAMTI